MIDGLGKLPPQNTDAEGLVLGAIMTEANSIHKVVDLIKPDDFYKDANQEIFRAMLTLIGRSEPIDMMTVVSELRKMEKLEACGGSIAIAGLASRIAGAANIEYHALIIKEMSIKRQLIVIGNDMYNQGYEDGVSGIDAISNAIRSLNELSGTTQKSKPRHIRESIDQIMVRTEKNIKEEKEVTGIPSGFDLIDKVLGGWMDSDLIILAARPGMGKTSFALTCAYNAALSGHKVAIISLEMPGDQLVMRIICIDTGTPLERIRKSRFNTREFEDLAAKVQPLKEKDIIIDDPASLTSIEMRSKINMMVSMYGIDMAIIDYLQLMKGSDNQKNREQEISEISQTLKNTAKENNIPILALAQLSRAVESRNEKIPQLSDLRDSGSIEQDADIVLFLYRPEYYKVFETQDGKSTKGQCDVIIAKHRNGALKDVSITFEHNTTKFKDYVEPELQEMNDLFPWKSD